MFYSETVDTAVTVVVMLIVAAIAFTLGVIISNVFFSDGSYYDGAWQGCQRAAYQYMASNSVAVDCYDAVVMYPRIPTGK